jgi:NADPH:quinone reductase-like Zn-dependent oxidoreductase
MIVCYLLKINLKAAVTTKAGDPSVIQLREVPMPEVKPGWVRIKVHAFGINRSEMFTRQGHSPGVRFPRIQGIECVGTIDASTNDLLPKGQQVAAIMGEMGRSYDGGYAEYCLVPEHIVFPFESTLPWSTLGAIPEMFQTVSGSLHQALNVKSGESLLIRGGTSSIGLLSAQLAKSQGLYVVSTTRNPDKRLFLLEQGVDEVIIDGGSIEKELRSRFPEGVNKVLELVGTATLKDSLRCAANQGVVCMTGILGDSWTLDNFSPMYDIPSTVRLTSYAGDSTNLSAENLQKFIDEVEKGNVRPQIDSILQLDEVPLAHQRMEESLAKGKMVVVTSPS